MTDPFHLNDFGQIYFDFRITLSFNICTRKHIKHGSVIDEKNMNDETSIYVKSNG